MRLTLTSGMGGLLVLAAVGCGGSSFPTSTDMSGTLDSAGARYVEIDNYMGWCSVTLNGGSASTDPNISAYSISPGVVLAATPISSAYQFGYWQFDRPGYYQSSDADVSGPEMGAGADNSISTIYNPGDAIRVCCPPAGTAFGSGCQF